MPGRIRAFVVALTLVGAAAGCSQAAPAGAGTSAPPGAGASRAAAGGTVDPCSLLTAEEIASATGLKVTGPGDPALQNGKECKWELEAGKNVEGVAFDRFVDVSIFGPSYFQGAAAVSPGPEAVSGVADQAVYVSDVLVALKGDRSFALTVNLHEAGNGTPELTTQEHDAALTLGKEAGPRF